MNATENTPTDTLDKLIDLGVASVETKGPGTGMELAGPGQQIPGGIAEE